jgi:hypothetical protein
MILASGHQLISMPCPDRSGYTALAGHQQNERLHGKSSNHLINAVTSALAVQLSQEADRLRRELSERDASTSQSDRPKEGADRLEEREQAALNTHESPFGYEVCALHEG